MAWRDWINSGGLFGGYGDYGSGLDQSALQRANKYGMAAAAATLMKSDPYDTRYGTKLFGSLLSGKMAMRDQLAEQQELLAKKRAAEILAARQEQEWEWKKAEAERKDREWWEKESTPEADKGVDDEIASTNLWAEKTGKDPSIFLGLPKVAQVAEMKKLTEAPEVPEEFIEGGSRWIRGADGRLKNLGFVPKRPDEEKKPDEMKLSAIASMTLRLLNETEDRIDPKSGSVVKAPKYSDPAAAATVASQIIEAAANVKSGGIKVPAPGVTEPGPKTVDPDAERVAMVREALTEDGEKVVESKLISRGYTKAQAQDLISKAKRGL